MSTTIVDEKSLEICKNLYRQTDWSKVKTVSCYQTVERLKEVSLKPLIDTLEYKHPDIKISFLERTKDQPLPRTKFDLIIVPVIAFDMDNNRLGWGAGWYDKFLAAQPRALKIGACYQNGFVPDGIPAEPHDIPLDAVITEN